MADIRSNDHAFLSAQFQRLSDDQCQKIHWASLEVMERTGVRLYEQEAVDLFQKAGGRRYLAAARIAPWQSRGHLRCCVFTHGEQRGLSRSERFFRRT